MSHRAIVLMPDEVILWKISGTTDDQIRQALGSFTFETNRRCFGGMGTMSPSSAMPAMPAMPAMMLTGFLFNGR